MPHPPTRPLILASTSRYRRRLLTDAGIDHLAVAPDFDERTLDGRLDELGPEGLAIEIARGKARSVHLPDNTVPDNTVPDNTVSDDAAYAHAIVLAADQLAVLGAGTDAVLLTKPVDVDAAVGQLMRMAGRAHRLVNGLVLWDPVAAQEWTATDVHEVHMGGYDETTARAYVEEFLPLDCVGSYRIEDDAGLIDHVVGGDRSGVIGLPIPTVRQLLALV